VNVHANTRADEYTDPDWNNSISNVRSNTLLLLDAPSHGRHGPRRLHDATRRPAMFRTRHPLPLREMLLGVAAAVLATGAALAPLFA
jgi:hypothetical protein